MKNLIIKILMKINIIILKLIAVFSSKNIIEIKEESIKNIIVFAPHADDESIGCAGIIKKHSLEGSNIIIVNMTDGKSSKSNLDKEKLAELRKKELLNVANKLCVKQVISLDFQDGNLQCGEDEILTVRNLISEYKPDIIYTPFFCDTHKDHVTTNLILINALKETGYECQIRAFEVQTPMTSMIFNSFYEISFFTETKKQLLLSYKSQTLEFANIFLSWTINSYFIKNTRNVEVFLTISSKSYVKLVEKYIHNAEDIRYISEKFYSSGSSAKILLTYLKGNSIRKRIKKDIIEVEKGII